MYVYNACLLACFKNLMSIVQPSQSFCILVVAMIECPLMTAVHYVHVLPVLWMMRRSHIIGHIQITSHRNNRVQLWTSKHRQCVMTS